jgi:hypothetical protein
MSPNEPRKSSIFSALRSAEPAEPAEPAPAQSAPPPANAAPMPEAAKSAPVAEPPKPAPVVPPAAAPAGLLERIAALELQLKETQERAISATVTLREREEAQKSAQRESELLMKQLAGQRRAEELDRQMAEQMAAHRRRIEELEQRLVQAMTSQSSRMDRENIEAAKVLELRVASLSNALGELREHFGAQKFDEKIAALEKHIKHVDDHIPYAQIEVRRVLEIAETQRTLSAQVASLSNQIQKSQSGAAEAFSAQAEKIEALAAESAEVRAADEERATKQEVLFQALRQEMNQSLAGVGSEAATLRVTLNSILADVDKIRGMKAPASLEALAEIREEFAGLVERSESWTRLYDSFRQQCGRELHDHVESLKGYVLDAGREAEARIAERLEDRVQQEMETRSRAHEVWIQAEGVRLRETVQTSARDQAAKAEALAQLLRKENGEAVAAAAAEGAKVAAVAQETSHLLTDGLQRMRDETQAAIGAALRDVVRRTESAVKTLRDEMNFALGLQKTAADTAKAEAAKAASAAKEAQELAAEGFARVRGETKTVLTDTLHEWSRQTEHSIRTLRDEVNAVLESQRLIDQSTANRLDAGQKGNQASAALLQALIARIAELEKRLNERKRG